MRLPVKPLAGRADLIALLAHLGPEGLEQNAALLGYQRPKAEAKQAKKEKVPDKPLPPKADPAKIEEPGGQDAPVAKPPGVSFWQPIGFTQKENKVSQVPVWYQQANALGLADLLAKDQKPPARKPLVPWSQLWPLLRLAAGVSLPTGRIDLDMAVQQISRGEVFKRFPIQKRNFWCGSCRILVDLSPALAAFRHDFRFLIQGLISLRGEAGLEILFTETGPQGPFYFWRQPWRQQKWLWPSIETPTLMLSDLGCLNAANQFSGAWANFFKTNRGQKPLVLAPCPPRLWRRRLNSVVEVVFWDRGRKMRPGRGAGVSAVSQEEVLWGAEQLLTLLAPAIRVESDLLRAVRFLLPQTAVDVAAEAAVWQHPSTRENLIGFDYEPSDIEFWRSRFAAEPDKSLKRQVGAQIQQHHAHLMEAVSEEERLILSSLTGEAPAASPFLGRVLKTLDLGGSIAHSVRDWVTRLSLRQNQSAWKRPDLAAVWARANMVEGRLPKNISVPKGLDPQLFAWLFGVNQTPKPWSLWQRGSSFLTLSGWDEYPEEGSQLARFISCSDLAWLEGSQGSLPFLLKPQQALPQTDSKNLVFHTDLSCVALAETRKPEWAFDMGRDSHGLFAKYRSQGREGKLRWLQPGPLPLAGQAESLLLQEGCWVNEDQFFKISLGLEKPDWADTFGLDEKGVFASFRVIEVVQVMRWIPPGTFMMGSPEGELERIKDEVQHQVILTQGFWLGETACSQALWQAVMGQKPSRFKGDDLPVEQVSWHDSQSFFTRLQTLKPGLKPRLPTEAEWEYACRAGSQTPFWFGENITTEQANFDGNFPYKGPKGKYRERTIPVKEMPANDWGLYQMHGNVWEWCSDWYGDYPSGTVVDPQGPESGMYPVLRGGSWFSYGGHLRSAKRYRNLAVTRYQYVGFRLTSG